jgi:hypothetical protein
METEIDTATEGTALAAAVERYRAEHCGESFDVVMRVWASMGFDQAVVLGWSPEQSRQGLIALERLVRSISAVQVVLVSQLEAGRNTTASIVRATGVSTSQARELQRAALVVEQHPSVLQDLAAGSLSTEHLAKVSHLKSDLAAEMLASVDGKSADEFRSYVDETRVQRESTSVSDEQHASRSVKIYRKRNGCVGINIVLPPIEGNEFTNTVEAIADQLWRAAHPDRAEVAGVIDVEPMERRLADAFISWMRNGNTATGKPAVIVIVEAETLQATVVPNQPIALHDAMTMLERANVYAAIRDGTNIANLKFGINKRVATPLQKLALLTDHQTCAAPGCDVSALRCDTHHIRYYERGGPTDIDNLQFLCRGTQGHHPHEHETNTQAA